MALGVGLGCARASTSSCESRDDCDPAGWCESTGYCSVPDSSCSSGRRYDDHASVELAGTCVAGSINSSGVFSEPTTSTSSSTLDGGSSTGTGSTAGSTADTGSTSLSVAETSTGVVESTGAGVPRVTDGLLALYRFDEGMGTAVADQAGVGAPLDLTIDGAEFQWHSDGLFVEGAIVSSVAPATKIIEGCQATGEMTVEAWVTPAAPTMTGPARIVTLSDSGDFRNFTLGQGNSMTPLPTFIGRVRTSDGSGSLNGIPELVSRPVATTALIHLAYVRSTKGYHRLYVDGQPSGEGERTGSFSNWNESYPLSCGNEPTLDRPWHGVLHLVAIYDRALDSEELEQNIDAGF